MANNVQLALQTTGQTISTEDNGSGIQLPRSKIMLGASGTDGGDVTQTNPLPVGAGQQVTHAYDGVTDLTPLYAIVDTASSGDNTIVAAVTSKKIVVLRWFIMASGGANNVRWIDGTPTNLTGLMNLLANQPVSGSYCPVGHFATASGKLLKLNLSAATQVSGYIVYVTV